MLAACSSPRWSRSQPTEHDLCVDWVVLQAPAHGEWLERRLDVCGAIAPPARTFVVTHPATVLPELAGRADHVLSQPASRGTGFGVYVALAMIRRWQPNAVVTIVTAGAASRSPREREIDELRALRRVGARWPERVAVHEHVACGTVDALWDIGRRGEPNLLDILDSLVPLVGTCDEDEAIEYIYRAFLPVNLAGDILQRAAERLVVVAA